MKMKKLLAVLLCLCLAAALLPCGALADLNVADIETDARVLEETPFVVDWGIQSGTTRTVYVGVLKNYEDRLLENVSERDSEYCPWRVEFTVGGESSYTYCYSLGKTYENSGNESGGSIYGGSTIGGYTSGGIGIYSSSVFNMYAAQIPADVTTFQVYRLSVVYGGAVTLGETVNCAFVKGSNGVEAGFYTPNDGGADPSVQTVYVGIDSRYEAYSFSALSPMWCVLYTTARERDYVYCRELNITGQDSGSTSSLGALTGNGYHMYVAEIPADAVSIQVYFSEDMINENGRPHGAAGTLENGVNCAYVEGRDTAWFGTYTPPGGSVISTRTVYVSAQDSLLGGYYTGDWQVLYTTGRGSGYAACRKLDAVLFVGYNNMYAAEIPADAVSFQAYKGSTPCGEAGTLANGVNCANVQSVNNVWYGTYTPSTLISVDPMTIVTHRPPADADTDDSGTQIESVKTPDGSAGTVYYDADGKAVSAKAEISEKAVSDAAENGAPVTLPVTAASGMPVTVTFSAEAGPVAVEIPVENLTPGTAAVIVHEDGTEELIRASVNGEKGVMLKLDGSATVKIIDNTKTFPDVASGSWFEPAVTWAASRGLFLGTDEGFEPGAAMTRAMLATVLYRLDGASAKGANGFDDVPDGTWFSDAVTWACAAGIVKGTGEGFEPNAPVTREQTAVMLYRYAGYLGLDTASRASLDGFPDGGLCESWARDGMSWAVSVGLFGGSDDGALDPGGSADRAEAAALLERFAGLMVK